MNTASIYRTGLMQTNLRRNRAPLRDPRKTSAHTCRVQRSIFIESIGATAPAAISRFECTQRMQQQTTT
jgi:hypothetical protein